MRIPIKPLSVNQCWQGKRFKTPKYRKYEADVSMWLNPLEIPEGNLYLEIEWGFSNMRSDVDNPAKPMIDILQKKYGFDDSRIYRLTLIKTKVKKGEEFIEFKLRGCP